jgi:hypothetical protein
MNFRAIWLAPVLLAKAAAALAATPGVVTYAVIGYADPNKKVPALDAVPGAGVSNVAVPLPIYIIQPGYNYNVTFGVQNLSFSGTCVASYTLAAGPNGNQLISNWSTEPYSCAANTVWTFPFPVSKIPNITSTAVLTAIVQFGSTTVKYSVPLTIQ